VFVEFLRRSQFLRALVITTGVFSFLTWLYIVGRILLNGVDVNKPFVAAVPSISFFELGAFTFAVSFVSMFLYLWLWGRLARGPIAP